MLLEYDPSTLAPLGLVVGKDELGDRQIAILDSGLDAGSNEKLPNREQAIVLYTEGSDENVTVIHPNEDGSYWRKIVRNKVVRMREFEERLQSDGVWPAGGTPDELKALIRREIGQWRDIIARAGIKPE